MNSVVLIAIINILPLGIFLFLEGMLSIYYIKIKAIDYRVTVMMRISSLIMLFLLSSINVLTWGWRYYALVIIQCLGLLVNIVRIAQKRVMTTEFKDSKIIGRATKMALLIFVALLPTLIFPEYELISSTGDYEVATVTTHLTDAMRKDYYHGEEARTITMQLWYPANTESQFPLIVFSHGALGIRTSNESLYHELASHGYIVCAVDHTYQSLYTKSATGKLHLINRNYLKQVQLENARENKVNSFTLYQEWMQIRIEDLNLTIDTLKANDLILPHVDETRIGVIGHSLGGSAALAIGRVREDIACVVALESPFLYDIKGVENDEFVFDDNPYPIPLLNIYSDTSWDNLVNWPQYQENVALLRNPHKDTFNLHIEGAGHLTLTDLALASPFFTRILNGHPSSLAARECLQIINRECLAFFDCYLKNQGVYHT